MPDEPLQQATRDTVPGIRVEFPFAPEYDKSAVSRVTWIQDRNKHDVMEMTVVGVRPERMLPMVPGGSPVQVTIWTSAGRKALHGYVHKAVPAFDDNPTAVNLTVVSAGYPLKAAGKLAIGSTTASMAVTRIARKHKLHADVESHPRKFRQLVQSGETDWEFLTRIADEVGYSLRVEGATLRFVSRSALAKHYRTKAPILRFRRNRGNRLYEVLSFQPTEAAYLDETGSRARRKVDYLDKYARKFSSSASDKPKDTGRKGKDPEYTRFTSATAKTFKEASLIAAARTEANRYPVLAKATIIGNPVIGPDIMVFIDGVMKRYEGYWTVLKATHYLLPGKYVTDIEIGLEESAGRSSPGARHASRYRLKTPYPAPKLRKTGVKAGSKAIEIPKFFQSGPRWVGRG